jgi:hypothetical protein
MTSKLQRTREEVYAFITAHTEEGWTPAEIIRGLPGYDAYYDGDRVRTALKDLADRGFIIRRRHHAGSSQFRYYPKPGGRSVLKVVENG